MDKLGYELIRENKFSLLKDYYSVLYGKEVIEIGLSRQPFQVGDWVHIVFTDETSDDNQLCFLSLNSFIYSKLS